MYTVQYGVVWVVLDWSFGHSFAGRTANSPGVLLISTGYRRRAAVDTDKLVKLSVTLAWRLTKGSDWGR